MKFHMGRVANGVSCPDTVVGKIEHGLFYRFYQWLAKSGSGYTGVPLEPTSR